MSYKDIISAFSAKRIAVIGDVMIDAYIWGEHSRMSPEAPVPVVDVIERDVRMGGAANVALNIKALDAEPIIITVLGKQGRSAEYLQLMEQEQMSTEGVIESVTRKCTIKTRVISNHKHMLRVDEEDDHDLDAKEEEALLTRCASIFKEGKIDAVVLQDYNKGVLTSTGIGAIVELAYRHDIPVMVDPKKKNFDAYRQVNLFKPNLKELREGLSISVEPNIASLDAAVEKLRSKMPHANTLITLSEHGVYWNDGEHSAIIPVFERDIVDVSGAGDTVISLAVLALVGGANLAQSAWVADLGGGLVCEKVGVQPLSLEALQKEIEILEQ